MSKELKLTAEIVLRPENVEAFVRALAEMLADSLERNPPPPEPAPGKGLMTIREAATRLGVSQRSMKRYMDLGHVRATKIGKLTRFSEAEIAAIAEKGLRPWLEDGIVKRRR